MNTSGQTFSLIHLVELVLAVLVIAIVGVGMLSMINGVQFYQQFYARDTAYMIEALHAVPNGNVEYGYLWSSPEYKVTIAPTEVIVEKTTPSLGGLIQGEAVKKAFGSGTTLVNAASFAPRYFVFALTDGRTFGSIDAKPTLTPRITVEPLSVERECPIGPGFTGIQTAKGATGDAVGASAAEQIVQAVRNAGAANTGLRVAVVYEAAPEPEVIVVNHARTQTTARIACIMQQQSTPSGIAFSQSTLAAEGLLLPTTDADIIVIMRGPPSKVNTVQTSIADGLIDARGGSQ